MTSQEEKIRLYLASSYHFCKEGKFFLYQQLIPAIEEAGYEVIDPWATQPKISFKKKLEIQDMKDRVRAKRMLNQAIGETVEKDIRAGGGLVGVLIGAYVDADVALAITCASMLGKPILGYKDDFRTDYYDKSTACLPVEYFIRRNKGTIVTTIDDLKKGLKPLFG